MEHIIIEYSNSRPSGEYFHDIHRQKELVLYIVSHLMAW